MAIGRVNELSALARPAALLLPLQRLGVARLPAPSTVEFVAAVLEAALEPVREWTGEDDEKLNQRVQSGAITAAAARSAKPNHEAARQLRGIMIAIAEAEYQRDAAADCVASGHDAAALRPVAEAIRAGVVERIAELQALSDQIYTLGEVFERKMGDSPSLGPVLNQLKSMTGVAARFLELFPDPAAAAAEPEATADGEVAAEGAPAAGGVAGAKAPKRFSGDTPQTRADVLVAIDAISRYYAENEPTSPVPLILKRVRGWVEADFYTLLKEISPDAVSDARKLLAIRDD
jgi:hypothetical protein